MAAAVVVAHPDDESLFFGPTVRLLLRERGQQGVFVLSLSSGNFDGLGPQRIREIVAACGVLGVPARNVTVIEHPQLQDGPQQHWPPEAVAWVVEDYCRRYGVTVVVTFDAWGVSGHPNHRAVHQGCAALRSLPAAPLVWALETVTLWRKYGGAAAWLWQALSGGADGTETMLGGGGGSDGGGAGGGGEGDGATVEVVARAGDVRQTILAMFQHWTQLVWYRVLFVLLSRYTFVNTLRPIDKAAPAAPPSPPSHFFKAD